MNAIEIRGLGKKYKNFNSTNFKLDNISLDLPYGCIMGLVGENGAGKSTTIKLILDIIKRDTGSIKIFGEEVNPSSNKVKNDIGVELVCKDNRLVTIKQIPEKYRAAMIFDSIETARALFDGKINALTCIGTGKIEMHGMVNMLDNVNRILDRVALYLA